MCPGAPGAEAEEEGQGWMRFGVSSAGWETGLCRLLGCWRGNISLGLPLPPTRSHLTLSFTNLCPFTAMHLRDLPNPQIYTRQERYRAKPPRVLEPSGFHTENSLAIYQGLVYYLLWLHSQYDKVGA